MTDSKQYYEHSREDVCVLLPEEYKRVLEIGCGAGSFRSNLTQEHEYWGVEPSAKAAELAKGNLNHVLHGNYDDVFEELPKNHFDMIVCNDVIEHMIDHDIFFEKIKDQLSDGGCIIASIPNIRFMFQLYELLINKDWQYKDAGILDRTHLRFFTKKSLLACLSEHGYTVEIIQGLGPCANTSFIKRTVRNLIALVIGEDTKYQQFGIRISLPKHPK